MPMRFSAGRADTDATYNFSDTQRTISKAEICFPGAFTSDTARASAKDAAARAEAYPSPPMSESHLQSSFIRRNSRDSTGFLYNSNFQDDYFRRRTDGQSAEQQLRESSGQDPRQGLGYAVPTRYDFKQQAEDQTTRQRPVPPYAVFATSLGYDSQPSAAEHAGGPEYHGHLAGGPGGFQESEYLAASKSQRKAKGHVASACVPCKRAHLRCDAQRPCSRCVSSGKEDACIDVQHKKRGRPRLRDDRDARFEEMRGSSLQESPYRQPTNLYQPGGPTGPAPAFQNEPFGRRSSFRATHGPGASDMSTPPRFQSASPSPSNHHRVNPGGLPTGEPVAYLTMSLEFVTASMSFLEATGLPGVIGRSLVDVVAPADRPRVSKIESEVKHEQKRREPNYLPPILGDGHRAIQALGFTLTDIQRSLLNGYERLNVVTTSGLAKDHGVRIGLGKQASSFFVILLLDLPPTRHHRLGPWHEGQSLPHHPPPADTYRSTPGQSPFLTNRPPHLMRGPSFEGQMGPPQPTSSWVPRDTRDSQPRRAQEHTAHYQPAHAQRQYDPDPSIRPPQVPSQSTGSAASDRKEGSSGTTRGPSRRVDIRGLLDD